MQIDYRKLAVLLLPTFLRRPILISILRAWMYPLQSLHDRHHDARTTRLYELAHTSQTCHIKDALNKEFGVGNYDPLSSYAAGFQIADNNAKGSWVWVYDEGVEKFDDEAHMLFDENTFVHNESVIMQQTTSFTVEVPNNVILNESNKARIRAIVNKYRLASRNFDIIKKS